MVFADDIIIYFNKPRDSIKKKNCNSNFSQVYTNMSSILKKILTCSVNTTIFYQLPSGKKKNKTKLLWRVFRVKQNMLLNYPCPKIVCNCIFWVHYLFLKRWVACSISLLELWVVIVMIRVLKSFLVICLYNVA